MRRLQYILTLPVLLVLLTGCLKEDYDNCERVRLTFSYLGDGQNDIFPTKITNVDLYVFDATNSLVQTKTIERSDLTAFQGTKMKLSPGEYHVVGVGNGFDKTETLNATSRDMSQIVFRHPNTKKGKVEGNDSLYLGVGDLVIPSSMVYEKDIVFRSAHLKVSYTVKGYTDSRAAEPLSLDVKNCLPQTDFNNNACGDKITYYPELAMDSTTGDFEAYFNIMRHNSNSDVEFDLLDSQGEVVHTLALKDFLTTYPQIDVSKQEVLIPIIIEFKHIGVVVTVPDWVVKDVTPGYGN